MLARYRISRTRRYQNPASLSHLIHTTSTPALNLRAQIPSLRSSGGNIFVTTARFHSQVRAVYLAPELAHLVSAVSVDVEQVSQVKVTVSQSTTAEAVRKALEELGCFSQDVCQIELQETVRFAIYAHFSTKNCGAMHSVIVFSTSTLAC